MNHDTRLDELLDRYEEAIERGERPEPEHLCQDAPELVEQFRAKVRALEKMNGLLNEETVALKPRSDGDTLRVNSELTRLKFHAKGGLGAVYRARETSVNRQVAVKFLHGILAQDADSRNRFTLEAEVTGRLEHPGVVPLYGIGEAENGRMFYYMRFIDGETMDDAIRRFHQIRSSRSRFAEQSVEFRRLLASFVSTCKTIAYAHNRGIVHRDIKPANIMLGKYGETLVVDWGLAIPVTRDQRFASSGEVSLRPVSASNSGATPVSGVGTAAYMSPEQASDLAPSPASDIYSLGATLYKILTGEPSVSGERVTELKQQIITGDIIPPRVRLPSVPSALQAVCLKAMALHPQERYQTALDLAEDIENYFADADVSAYDEPFSHKLNRVARKHQVAAQTAAAGLIAVFVITACAAVWLASMASSERDARREAVYHQREALHSRDTAEAARKENLKTSATFLAESIAHQIDQRWRIMETARSSPDLIRHVQALNADPDDVETSEELQRWLSECKESRDFAKAQNAIWVVLSQNGTIVARVPKSLVISKSFSHRDYFHGYGRDLAEGDEALGGMSLADLRPHQFVLQKLNDHEKLHSAHVSDVFQSKATHHLQVTFTVPIWDRPVEQLDKEAIGAFAISLEIQNLPLPDNAMIIQLRPDQISEKPGLVISHRELESRTEKELPPRVTSIIAAANQLTKDRLRERRQGVRMSTSSIDPFLSDFVDPVVESNTGQKNASFAVFEPVLVHSRPEPIADVGWVVIVREPRESAEQSNEDK